MTNTLCGCECVCAPMPGIGQSPMEIGLNLFPSQKIYDLFHCLWMAISHRWASLLSFEDALGGSWISGSHSAGEFDDQFHPNHEQDRSHWLSGTMACLSGGDLPAADMVELDGRYFVCDGHYRISVAQRMGQQYIDAEIIRMHNQKMWF